MGKVSLDSFLDRLGLEEGDQRFCVWLAFVPVEGEKVLPGEQAMDCLGWVAAVQEGKMKLEAFQEHLKAFLRGLDSTFTPEALDSLAKCMLSGHAEPDA